MERPMTYVGPMMRLMQLDLKVSSPSMVNLNDRRLDGVNDPSSESNDHEKAAFRKPIMSSRGDIPAVS